MRAKRNVKYIYLSHLLKNRNPSYGKTSFLNIKKIRSIGALSSVNMYEFCLQSHYGTHVDTPNHFFDYGKKVSGYPPEFWHFTSPQILDVRLSDSDVLKLGRWAGNIKKEADILLLRSGWGRYRGQKRYSYENPGIHPEVGFYLRENYPRLRAVGIDWISISPYRDRPLGRQSHKAFLDPKGNNCPILIIEDMSLPSVPIRLEEIHVAPLRIDKIDSAPCVITGISYD